MVKRRFEESVDETRKIKQIKTEHMEMDNFCTNMIHLEDQKDSDGDVVMVPVCKNDFDKLKNLIEKFEKLDTKNEVHSDKTLVEDDMCFDCSCDDCAPDQKHFCSHKTEDGL